MSIEKISPTEWEHEYPCGDWNDICKIEATKEGLVINYDLLSWKDIEKAKAEVFKNNKS